MTRQAWHVIAAILMVACWGANARSASIVSITNDGSTKELLTIEVNDGIDDIVYDASDFIVCDVTDIVDGAYEVISGSNPPAGSRGALLEDMEMDTGFLNLSTWAVDFSQPVVNRPGFDVILSDWGDSPQGDRFTATVGGVSRSYYGPDDGMTQYPSGGGPSANRYASGVSVANLAEAESVSLSANGTTAVGGHVFYGIDLSELGIADGDSVTSMSFSDGSGIDPCSLFGLPNPAPVPEPSAMLGLLAMVGCGLGLRRRNRS